MKTLAEVKELFGVSAENTSINFYKIEVNGNPYETVSSHATEDVSVSVCVDEVYACTAGTIDVSIAIKIIE